MQKYVNSNIREIIKRIFYGLQLFILVLLLRPRRFPEIRTCEKTDEVGLVIGCTMRFKNNVTSTCAPLPWLQSQGCL
jgi:hypothetical protein